uniref:Uncharacterized protein n=1 Tax=Trichobilharzia regenti TaxID=157069 RepID=A0AA85J252_TRIRE|nr:unnamed protein product [Trichobilharzia regenti]
MKITYLICIVSLVVFRNVAAEAEETLTSENATETTTILDDAVAVEETLTVEDLENLQNFMRATVHSFQENFVRFLKSFFWTRVAAPVLSSLGLNQTFTVTI